MERWTNRVALVTGASQGIGANICRELVKQGMIVVGCARNVESIEELAMDEEVCKGPGKMHPMRCDLEEEDEILEMFDVIRETIGRVDVCINNAAYSIHSPLDSGDIKDWKNMIEVNVMALCIVTRESLALMKAKNIEDGQIIHIGSIFSHKLPVNPPKKQRPCMGIYNGTKFMVKALAESLRQELKMIDSRIKVATISPGAVDTDTIFTTIGSEFSAAAFVAGKKMEQDKIKEACLKCEDISEAVKYILSSPIHVNVEDVIVQPVKFAA